MNTLDLDINNYSIKDIEKFFKLKTNTRYSASDIELKEAQIRETLLNSGHIDKRFKSDLISFLTLAKNWLIFVKCPAEKPPTVIPKNYKLDAYDTPLSKEPMSRLEELIQRPETQFIYTNPSEVFPGKINPLNTRVITKCLTIDTRFRDNLYNTQSSDFTIQLPTKFNKVISMQLSAIELPVAFYGISASYGNNFLYMKINYDLIVIDETNTKCTNIDTERIFTIPDGNYTANDLIDTINFMISPENQKDIFKYIKFSLDINENGSGSRRVSVGPVQNEICNINEITLDFTKNSTGQLDNVNIFTKLGWNLGFTKPIYHGNTFYTAETIIEPSTKYIYLAIDDFNNCSNNHFISAFNQSILNTDILARVSIKGTMINLISENDYNLVTEPRQYFGPVDIQRLRIRLFDEFGRILSMNNSNYSFCLSLKILYDL
jgi:hypothetical protein